MLLMCDVHTQTFGTTTHNKSSVSTFVTKALCPFTETLASTCLQCKIQSKILLPLLCMVSDFKAGGRLALMLEGKL